MTAARTTLAPLCCGLKLFEQNFKFQNYYSKYQNLEVGKIDEIVDQILSKLSKLIWFWWFWAKFHSLVLFFASNYYKVSNAFELHVDNMRVIYQDMMNGQLKKTMTKLQNLKIVFSHSSRNFVSKLDENADKMLSKFKNRPLKTLVEIWNRDVKTLNPKP